MNTLDDLLKWLPAVDFAVLEHRFARHGRDYLIIVEDCLGSDPGQHEIAFTHCVLASCQTRLGDATWLISWNDDFIDYEQWERSGEPDGYVWGTNWSLAYPGLQAVPESAPATEWSRRLGKQMFEVNLTTDRYFLRLVFHSVRWRKLSDQRDTVSRVIHHL